MMKIQIINKEKALIEANKIKEKAFGIAESFGTLPGYCMEPECIKYVQLISLTQLKEGEGCIFIDGEAAEQLTNFEIEPGKYVIGKLCVRNVIDAFIENERLCLKYNDGIIEYFKFREDLNCWEFEVNSLGTKIKPEHGIFN
jgi:hypothetical protein